MKTKPFNHQKTTYLAKRNLDHYALFWEQGCGKTKTAIDVLCHKYQLGDVNALLVVAPNAVHPNWAYDEIPIHMWDEVERKILVWDSKKVSNKSFQRTYDNLLKFKGLAIITMNYEALISKKTFSMIEEFITARKTMMICDESHRIKNPSAGCTKAVLNLAPHAVSRWILTGTSYTQSPFDIFSQFKFLDKTIIGINSYFGFKNRYGTFIKMPNAVGGQFNSLVSYRNLDQLKKKVLAHSSRVLKEDVLDLPEKIYQTRYITMPPNMEKIYKQMKKDFLVELDNEIIAAPLMISKMGKLQQIVCGFIFDENANPIEFSTARVDAMMEDFTGEKTIIWAKYKTDHKMISERLTADGIDFVSYTGDTSTSDREIARNRFQKDPLCIVFLGNPAACSMGITLNKAKYVFNYNRSFSLTTNQQSEDRAHRIGTEGNVVYTDYIMRFRNGSVTIDGSIVKNLRSKNDMATMMNNDRVRDWI